MEVKLIAKTEMNPDVMRWPGDEEGGDDMDFQWSINEYTTHPFKATFYPVEGSEHVTLSYEGSTNEDADELGEIAGRLCYKSWSRPNPTTATNLGYLGNIIAQQHFSVLEHASATFWISGVSRSLTHELVRHRHLSFSQVSQRYVDESRGQAVVHPALKEASSVLGWEVSDATADARVKYRELVEKLMLLGVDRKTARGAARGVLPNATATELIVTGNHRTWRELLSKRLSPGADAEIRALSVLLLAELKRIAPNTYQDFEEVKE